MKKKLLNGITVPVMVLALLVSMMAIGQPAKANSAADAQRVNYGKKATIYRSSPDYALINMGKKGMNAKSMTIRSSNKKVVAPNRGFAVYKEGKKKYPVIKVKKPGKAVLTIKVKKKGKVRKYKCRVTVRNYKSPVRSVKLEGKDLTGQLRKEAYASHKRIGEKGRISIKTKKGWTIRKIVHHYCNSDGVERSKRVKNNAILKLKDGDYFNVLLYNKKQNGFIKIQIGVENPENEVPDEAL